MSEIKTLENPLLTNLKPPLERELLGPVDLGLPAGTRIISADDHWDVVDDVFYERFPEHLREKAPRVFKDGIWMMGVDDGSGKLKTPMNEIRKAHFSYAFGLPGSGDLESRLKDMDREGMDASILFGQFVAGYLAFPDLEVREAIFRIYNEYIVERAAQAPDRLYPVAILSNWWDGAKAEAAVQQVVDLGLKAIGLPVSAGRRDDGERKSYADPEFDRLWSVLESAGLPITFHIGEQAPPPGRGALGAHQIVSFQPFGQLFGQLAFGGVFDRNPKLKVVFTEGGIGWVPSDLQMAELVYDSHRALHETLPKERPSYYWANNCWATFMTDKFGLENIHYIGWDKVMWSCDYPHSEGAYGYSWQSRKAVVDAVGPEKAAMILGGTAKKLFKL